MLEAAGTQVYKRSTGQRETAMALGPTHCPRAHWASRVYLVLHGVPLAEFEDFLLDCGSVSPQCGGCFFGV